MTKENRDTTASLSKALNEITHTIYNHWNDLSERGLSTDDMNQLTNDLKFCAKQIKHLSNRIADFRS